MSCDLTPCAVTYPHRHPRDDEPWVVEVLDSEGAEEQFVAHSVNPLAQESVTGGVKDNRGKPAIDLLSGVALVETAKVMEYGTRKYKPNNWRLGLSWSQTFASAQRHLWAWLDGEEFDAETGISHLAHAMCQVMFLLEYSLTGTGQDDRWVTVREEDPSAARRP